ncbi:type VII secretion protein EccCb [Streptomyces sp. NPDC046716]|uniref:type VII secretion protein EccCb n=1 Tax=Streptomyces sp. NPDC046716 TaxID=3157093 RepID=UPI0033DFBFC9
MAGRRIALLIATDGYDDPGLSRLRAPARGATDLQALLQDPAIGRYDHVRTLLNRPKAEIEAAVEELLADRSPDDLVLLYLSCHGVRTEMDRLYFATLGTRLARPGTTAIPARFLHEHLDDCQAGTKVVLLDCCYSGLFHRGAPMSHAPVDVGAALGGRGTFVITASTALEYAYDGDQQLTLDNSTSATRFTAAVIEALSTGLADQDHDGIITPDELYQYVHDTVVNQAGPEQTPTKSGQYEGTVPLAYAPDKDISAGPAGRAAAAHELLLGELLPPPVETTDRGFVCDAWEGSSRLMVPVGRLEHAAGGEAMCLDLAGREGNLAAVGKLGSGKTTLLRSLVLSLALTHSPDEVEFVLFEGAVNRLGVLRGLPHVRTVVSPDERDGLEKALGGVLDVITTRRRLFLDHDIDSVEAFRTLRAEGELAGDGHGDLFVVVDGWMDFCWELSWFNDRLHRLANTGLNYGIHLVAATRRWSDFSPDLLGLLGTRVELALDDPLESSVDPTLAASVGTGWALARRRRFRVAVPRLDEVTGDVAARRSLADTTQRVRTAWQTLPTGSPRSRRRPWVSFAQVLGLDEDLRGLDLDTLRAGVQGLDAPLGRFYDTDKPLTLSVGDPGAGGMGQHGLIVGGAGSGKSELLRTLVLSFALHHTPGELNFLLVAAGGSHTFDGLTTLPHVSATVDVDPGPAGPGQLDRLIQAVTGEIRRRQDLLRSGRHTFAYAHHEADAADPWVAPVPNLFVVVEDFVTLLEAKPDLMEVFVQIGRLGRALGVHLLLGARRLPDGVLRGLTTHLAFRIALRTATPEESRIAIGVTDAHRLPRDPGVGYLQWGTDFLRRFQAAYASAPHEPGPDSVLDVVAHRLADERPSAYQVILPPLHEPPTLESLLTAQGHSFADTLKVPVGLADKPLEHRRDVWTLDFSGEGGHLLVAGRPGSGKTTLLTTLVCGFALLHPPSTVQFYLLDLDGGLADLDRLPHVGGVAARTDGDRVQRTVAEVSGIMRRREEWARRHATDPDPDDRWGDVFLVVDGISTLRAEYESLEPTLESIARHGRRSGVHLVVTTSRHTNVRLGLHEQFDQVVELRLTDPVDSYLDRRRASLVPEQAPGHGLSSDRYHVLTALPRLDRVGRTAGSGEALDDLTAEVIRRWGDVPPAPPVRMLPSLLSPAELPPLGEAPGEVLRIGLDESSLDPVDVDFEKSPLFLAFGEPGSGKTSLLRMIGRQVTGRFTPKEAQLVVVDYRRTLLDAFPDESVLGYGLSMPHMAKLAKDLTVNLTMRVPGPDVPTAEMRKRNWYKGPLVYLLVDNYDLVATASGNPLTPLLELLPYAREVGLRVILTRRTGGAAQALYEPFLRQVRDLDAQGVVLSGDRAEGDVLGSIKPRQEPPGRGTLFSSRHTHRRVQLAYDPPEPPQATDPIRTVAPAS